MAKLAKVVRKVVTTKEVKTTLTLEFSDISEENEWIFEIPEEYRGLGTLQTSKVSGFVNEVPFNLFDYSIRSDDTCRLTWLSFKNENASYFKTLNRRVELTLVYLSTSIVVIA